MRTCKCIALTAALLAAGCGSNKTETGYEPHRLGMNSTQLRALYAPAFTPEAHAPQTDRGADVRAGANRPY